jgi:hypothetical protein
MAVLYLLLGAGTGLVAPPATDPTTVDVDATVSEEEPPRA